MQGSNLFLSLALTWKLFWGRCHCGEVGQLRPLRGGGGCVCGKSGEKVEPLSGLSKANRKGTTEADASSLKPNPPAVSRGDWQGSSLSWSTLVPLCQNAPHPARSGGRTRDGFMLIAGKPRQIHSLLESEFLSLHPENRLRDLAQILPSEELCLAYPSRHRSLLSASTYLSGVLSYCPSLHRISLFPFDRLSPQPCAGCQTLFQVPHAW